MFFPKFVTRLRQSTEERWEHFTEQALDECEESRQKSVKNRFENLESNFDLMSKYRIRFQIKLRSTIDAVLLNAARDLRTKADNVMRAFNKRIATMDDARIKLEMELTEVNGLLISHQNNMVKFSIR